MYLLDFSETRVKKLEDGWIFSYFAALRDDSQDSAASHGWSMGTLSRVVVVDEVLGEKVSKKNEG